MKYSLRILMIAALVLPPLLAVGWFGVAMPVYRWWTEPKMVIDTFGFDSDLPHIPGGVTSARAPDLTFELPDSQAPAPNPSQP
jgi:hypothetical protein